MSTHAERSTLSELKVIQGQEETNFYLHTVLNDEGESGIRLCLTDVEDVWEGELSEDDLDLLRARLKMDFKSYVEQTVAALTRHKLREVNFEYQLKALPSNRMQLVWKKCVSGDQIKFQLGSVSLEKSDNPNDQLRNIFSQCISSTLQLKNRIQDLESTCERLAQDRQNAVKRLDKCVSAKEELEHDLYSKFMAVLNSKKERIRLLEESGHENVPEDVNGSPEEVPMTSGESIRKRGRSDFSKDTDTEDNLPVKQAVNTNKKEVDDSSINLGDGDDDKGECDVQPAARRPRRQGPVKKQTPSKPVLPRASSGKGSSDSSRQAGSNRRSSMRKSGSNSSKSLGSVDPNDLLGEM